MGGGRLQVTGLCIHSSRGFYREGGGGGFGSGGGSKPGGVEGVVVVGLVVGVGDKFL